MKTRFLIFGLLFTGLVLFIYLASQPYIVKFSKDYYYDYETNSIFGKGVDIPPEIVDFVYDKNFVAVKQKPNCAYDFMYDYPENFNYENGINETYYWLILLAEKTVHGPFLYDEFESLCKKYEVQLSLPN